MGEWGKQFVGVGVGNVAEESCRLSLQLSHAPDRDVKFDGLRNQRAGCRPDRCWSVRVSTLSRALRYGTLKPRHPARYQEHRTHSIEEAGRAGGGAVVRQPDVCPAAAVRFGVQSLFSRTEREAFIAPATTSYTPLPYSIPPTASSSPRLNPLVCHAPPSTTDAPCQHLHTYQRQFLDRAPFFQGRPPANAPNRNSPLIGGARLFSSHRAASPPPPPTVNLAIAARHRQHGLQWGSGGLFPPHRPGRRLDDAEHRHHKEEGRHGLPRQVPKVGTSTSSSAPPFPRSTQHLTVGQNDAWSATITILQSSTDAVAQMFAATTLKGKVQQTRPHPSTPGKRGRGSGTDMRGRSRMISRHRSRPATSPPSAARFWFSSRSSRRAPSPSGSSSASAWPSWPSRCRRGRMSCPPWSRALEMTSRAMPVYWTSCECSPRRSPKAAKSPSLYVDRTMANRPRLRPSASSCWDRPRICL